MIIFLVAIGMKEALCVGISEYPDRHHRLQGCARDALDMATLFLDTFQFDKVTLVAHAIEPDTMPEHPKLHFHPDLLPTRTVILDKLTELARPSSETEEDVVVFYFSGHGLRVHSDDVRSSFVESLLTLPDADGISVVVDCELRQKLRQIGERRSTTNVVAIVDSCHAAGMAKASWEFRPLGTPRVATSSARDREFALQKKIEMSKDTQKSVNYVLMAACRDSEQALEGPVNESPVVRGWFTYALTAALRRDSQIQYCSYENVLRQVNMRAIDRSPMDSKQTPIVMGPQMNKQIFSTQIASTHEHAYRFGGVSLEGGDINGLVHRSTWIFADYVWCSPFRSDTLLTSPVGRR